MLSFLISNLATILIALALAGVVAAIVINLVRANRRGETTCGQNCAHCAMAKECHARGPRD